MVIREYLKRDRIYVEQFSFPLEESIHFDGVYSQSIGKYNEKRANWSSRVI